MQPTENRSTIATLAESVIKDVRYAVRSLVRRPGFAITAVLTLALGIGANTAVFSVVNSIVLRPLPFTAPARLVHVWSSRFVSQKEIAYLRANAHSYTEVGSFSPGWLMSLTGVSEPAELNAASVSGNLFHILGVTPLIGRSFGLDTESPSRSNVTLLGYDVWKTRFAGDPSIVGKTIQMNGQGYTVLGVMPRGFQVFGTDAEIWIPLALDPTSSFFGGTVTQAIGRLKNGITAEMASAELRQLASRMRTEFGELPTYGKDAAVASLKDSVIGSSRTALLIILAAVGLVLFIATTNVANLLLTRATERQVELSVRASLGASRGRITRQLITESTVLALAGGAISLMFAVAGVRALQRVLPPDTPRLNEIGVNATLVIAALCFTLFAAIAFSVGPSLLGARQSLESWLRRGRNASTGRSLRGSLITAEVALAFVLCTGAVLMLRTISAVNHVDPGFRSDHILSMRLIHGQNDSIAARAYWRALRTRVSQVPGVSDVATVLHLPMSGRAWRGKVIVEDRPLPAGVTPPSGIWEAVSGNYFGIMGVPVLSGRALDDRDREGGDPAIVINDVLARKLFGRDHPLGHRIQGGNATGKSWFTIVGVVASMRHDSLTGDASPEMFVSIDQRLVGGNTLVLRTKGDPRDVIAAVRQAVWSVDPNVPISKVQTIDAMLHDSTAQRRSVLSLFGAFAALGIVLGFIGIYGVVAYSVRQRARELSIRMALGASPMRTLGTAMSESAMHAGLGIAVGFLLSFLARSLLAGLLFGVAPGDAVTFAVVPATLAAAALIAMWIPARRVAQAQLAVTLRD